VSKGRDMKPNTRYVAAGHRRRKHLCSTSGKIRYRDGHDAMLALERLRRKRAQAEIDGAAHRIRVQRKYWCPSCDGWHLTSQPRDRTAAPDSSPVEPVAANATGRNQAAA
jgi:hypothetical protein